MRARAERGNDPLSIANAVASMLVVAYGIWNYWGPYKWVAELELRIFGSYEVRLTLLFSFLVCFLIFLPVQLLLQRLQSDIGGEKKSSELSEKMNAFVQSGSGQAILAGLGMLMVGVYNLGVAYSLGSLTSVDVATLDAHSASAPTARWWKVQGRLLFSETQVWESNHTKNYYIPLVSPSWKPGQPVSVVLREEGLGYDRLPKGPAEFVGLADLGGIPGQVRDHWESTVATVGAQTVLFANGDGPNKRESMGMFFSIAGSGLILLGLGNRLYTSRKRANP